MKTFIITTALALNSLFAYAGENKTPQEQKVVLITKSTTLPTGETAEIKNIIIDSDASKEVIEETSKIVADELKESKDPKIIDVSIEDAKVQKSVSSLKDKIIKRLKIKSISEYRTVINERFERTQKSSAELFKKHERISLSIVRTMVNGATVSAGLIINGGLSPATGLSIGFFSGAISGLFQFYNASFQTLIDGNPEKNKITIETKKLGAARVKTYQMTKWFLTEVSIYALIKGFSYTIGAPTESLNVEALKVLKSSLMATASQGLWESTLATETKVKLSEAGENEANRQRVQRISNVKTFAVSMVSVFGGILSLMGAQVGTWTLGALGATGIIYTLKAWKNGELTMNNTALEPSKGIINASKCRKVFQ